MDDDEAMREMMKKMLEAMSYEAVTVSDGRKGLELFDKEIQQGRSFTAMILDLTVKGGMGGKRR